MQPQIPDDLATELYELARGLNVNVDDAVRQALENWVAQQRRLQTRLPDAPILDEGFPIPYDLPHSNVRAVNVTTGAPRLPDAIELR
jgi:hypothetical protein